MSGQRMKKAPLGPFYVGYYSKTARVYRVVTVLAYFYRPDIDGWRVELATPFLLIPSVGRNFPYTTLGKSYEELLELLENTL